MKTTARKINVAVLAATILLSAAGAVNANADSSSSAQMRVSATVLARTLVDVDRSLDSVSVTDEDIRRGYVEVPQALALRVKSNSRDGYLLRFDPLQGPFTGGELTWGSNIVQLGADERWISQRREEQGVAVMDLRLKLASDIQPGVYPVNLRVTGDSI